MDLKGLYFHDRDGHHTYGIQAIADPDIFDKLKQYYYKHSKEYKWFLQSDSSSYKPDDKSFLFIEYLGSGYDFSTALEVSIGIARECGIELKII